MKIAILDEYQNFALEMVAWSALSESAEITAFNDCKGRLFSADVSLASLLVRV
jgi:hypothetical protein